MPPADRFTIAKPPERRGNHAYIAKPSPIVSPRLTVSAIGPAGAERQALSTARGASAILDEATFGLARRHPEKSARRPVTTRQAVVALATAIAAALGAACLPASASWSVLNFWAGMFFLSVIALRLLCLMRLPRRRPAPPALRDFDLPIYSVLVPLFRETAVLDQLLEALTRLHYPPSKLDIKLILEEGDSAMRLALSEIRLPRQFEVLVVPRGRPQTKPRALNFALRFVRGSLLTIYDAEDVPERMQLRLAAAAFAHTSQRTACIQARLDFYNPSENWLTRQFTIEYATLFGLLLPALAACRLPVPLGGTSNHFRVQTLRGVGAWDPFNVTEDADLGLRLARAGFRTEILDSRTFEEANMCLMNWLRQRARWLKGFLITWLVHMRSPLRLAAELGAGGFCAVQALTLGIFLSALLHPLFLAGLVITPANLPSGANIVMCGLTGLNLVVLLTGYAGAILAGRKALRRSGITGWALPLATIPVYWLLMSAAAWMALWQFITAPAHWNKTEHGLSSFQNKRQPR